MIQFQEHTLEVKSKKIHYYFSTKGQKPPMIFLHGFGDNGMCYDHVAEHFLETHDIYLIDARGHGQSSDPSKTSNFFDLIEDVHDLCTHQGLKDIIVVGHSMGGAEAALFAAENPQLVKAVVLEDPVFIGKKNALLSGIIIFIFSLFSHHRETPAPLEKYEKRSRKLNFKWAERDQLVWAQAAREFDLHYSKKDVKMLVSGAKSKDILPRIQAPILLCTSQRGLVRKSKARFYQTLNHHLQWEYIPNAGHNIRREQFEIFVNAIQKFLKLIEM